jgi:hypothetical protein
VLDLEHLLTLLPSNLLTVHITSHNTSLGNTINSKLEELKKQHIQSSVISRIHATGVEVEEAAIHGTTDNHFFFFF